MNRGVLHLIDQSTTADGLEMLGTLLVADESDLHGVLVMGHVATATRAIAAGVPTECIKHVHTMGAFDPSGWRGVRQIVRQYDPSYVHAWGFGGMVAATMLRLPRARRIATFTQEPNSRWRKVLWWMARRRAWLWLAQSDRVAMDLRKLTPRGAEVSVEVIQPGIRTSDSPASDATALRKALGIQPADGPIVLLGGEMAEPAARQRYGLWAGAIVQHIYPGLRMLLHPGHSQPLTWRQEVLSVRQLAATAPDPKFVIYDSPELPWLDTLQVADVLLATPDAPISSNSILWAMAAGVPIIATNIPQMQALIEDRRTGLLAEVNKPRSIAATLEELLSDSALGKSLAAAAREHVRNVFPAERMIERLGGIYGAQTVRDESASPEILSTTNG